ncbi:cytochrome c [Comamonas sp. 26]|uniref:c-type cytochrome n=1 Tax=Comamonas sp. 26 TaxID=2035201 RepID=UPI000C19FA03|nr:cytochrome c [Comamonas sp. 26]PIG07894.1 mono/diheme cytochrome c family protein [Comamonas sp. 26]
MRTFKKILIGGAALVAVLAVAGLALTHQGEIATQASIPSADFTPQQIAKGKLLAAMGDCAVCHTAANGKTNAGGLAMPSPFGTIYTSNITPDMQTGIGSWTYEAFERAMRHGVDREGQYLYPAFPYTAFSRVTDEDMKDLYAFLMSEPAVSNEAPKTALNFPYNVRRGIAAWNWLNLKPGVVADDAQQAPEWKRGAYLVEGLGHCSACHTPRNGMAAEKTGEFHFAGGSAEGWDAPALTSKSASPLPWTKGDLVEYMKTGFSERHSVAAGPMAPVAHGLSQQSDADIDAIATYLMSYRDADAAPGDAKALIEEKTAKPRLALDTEGYRLYQGACIACHRADPSASTFGVRPQLALSTSLHSASPDNAIMAVLEGVQNPAHADLGTMPAFRHALSDAQIATLLNTMRMQYGVDGWKDLPAKVGQLRKQTAAQTH